jgi:four helix bundle protein
VAGITKFEDIEAWKKARDLTKIIYAITSTGDFARDFGLRNQMRRASVSVMSNIAEGFEREGNKEFLQFLSLAKGSAGEVRAQSYVALDAGLITESEFSQLYSLSVEVSSLLRGFMNYLSTSDYRGGKYRPRPASPQLSIGGNSDRQL